MTKNVTIRTRLIVSYLGIALFVIVLAVVIGNRSDRMGNKYQAVIDNYDKASVCMAGIDMHYLQLEKDVVSMVNVKSASDVDFNQFSSTLSEWKDEINEHFEELDEAVVDDEVKDMVKEIKELQSSNEGVLSDILASVQNNQVSKGKELYTTKLGPDAQKINEIVEEMIDKNEELAKASREDAQDAQKYAIILLVIIDSLLVIFIVVTGIITLMNIRIPLKEMVEATKELAVGKLDVTIKKKNNDEIGELADALNELIAKNVRATGIAEKISKGDLSMLVKPDSGEDVLGNAFKDMVDANNGTLSHIVEAARQVETGSQQVAIASQSLAQGSTEQASAIQQVTASINDITERTRVNADNATEVNDLVKKTKDNAAAGNLEMSEMVSAMRDINESSENISKIIKTIDDIAFQTNILALNAAVEAARAGEHGKGFAVVAEEVRNLAAKSAAAASETADMIEDSIGKVQNGSELATKTAEMLGEIVDSVSDIVNLVEGIAEASNDQAAALEQINQAVGQVSQVVQTNSATSEQCAAASEELSNQAKNMKVLVGRYKLKGISGAQNFALEDDSFGATSSGSFIGTDYDQTASRIPDASDFAGSTNTAENEKIISLEDNDYSKY